MSRTFSRLSVLLVVASLLVGASAIDAGATTAARQSTACAPRVVLPSRIVIDRPYRAVRYTWSGLCSSVSVADWSLYGSRGWADGFYFDRSDPAYSRSYGYLDIYDWDMRGVYTTRDGSAYDRSFNSIPVGSSSRTEVRVAQRAGINLQRRSSNILTVNMSATRYSWVSERFVRADAVATIQRYSGGRWVSVSRLRLGSDGAANVSLVATPTRSYRVVMDGTPTVWPATSRTVAG